MRIPYENTNLSWLKKEGSSRFTELPEVRRCSVKEFWSRTPWSALNSIIKKVESNAYKNPEDSGEWILAVNTFEITLERFTNKWAGPGELEFYYWTFPAFVKNRSAVPVQNTHGSAVNYAARDGVTRLIMRMSGTHWEAAEYGWFPFKFQSSFEVANEVKEIIWLAHAHYGPIKG